MAAYTTGRLPRLSLEHLIRTAQRDTAMNDGGDNEIIIDRSAYASRRNGRLASITSSMERSDNDDTGAAGTEAMTIEAKYWRNLYMTLKQENNDDVHDVDNLLQLTLDREAQLQAYARLLEHKIDTIIAPLQDSTASVELSKKIETQRKLLRFYETMTSLSVKRRPGTDSGNADLDDSVYECKLNNSLNRSTAAFSLQLQEVAGHIKGALSKVRDDQNTICKYSPMNNEKVLPTYLQKSIDCEPSMAPVILSDVLHSLYNSRD